jgi:dTDP-4-dehydrorhamnose reductase
MKIAVTGRNGQLARSLVERAVFHGDVELVMLGRPQFDLLDQDSVLRTLEAVRPDVVISAAAYTAVDKAESEPELAFKTNADGPGYLADAARRVGASIIHISTDYVFDGTKGSAYDEGDAASPISTYGLSKYAGELAVSGANNRSLILRIAWAHSPYGRNFVRSMLELAETRRQVRVVADRFGSPTSMLDVADAILHVVGRVNEGHYGTYHLVNRGTTSWAGFANHIFAASRAVGGPWAEVEEIDAFDFPLPAPRPISSPLDSRRFEGTFSWALPSWQEGATAVAQRIAQEMKMPLVSRQ